MNNIFKRISKIFLIILCVILVIVGSVIVYFTISPNPVVWLLRNQFSEENNIINVENYDDIKQNVTIIKDLTYPSNHDKNTYDIYLPNEINENLKTIIWVHGGAFVAGSKDGIENYAVMLANEGYAVIGADYQWAPEIKYPGQVKQVEECIQELNNIKDEYHLDLNNIVLFGDSAGAHIAAQAALLASNPQYEKALGVDSEINSNQLKAVVLYCGPYDVSKMLNTGNKQIDFFASRIGWALIGEKDWQHGNMIKTTTIKDYTTSDFPPSFISDGNNGSFESQGKELVADLINKGVKVDYLFFDKDEYGDINHEYQFSIGDNGAGSMCFEKTVSFLKDVFN